MSKTPAKLPWAVWPKKEVSSQFPRPQALPGLQQHLAQLEAPAYRDSPVSPLDFELELEALDLETGLLGEKGQLLCYREICGALLVAGMQERQI